MQSLLGGSSYLEKRAALRQARRDPEVKAVMLKVDSPGGAVSGLGDLAAAVAETDKVKPVYAFIEDLGASAAYRVASRARKVYANADAQVGSIGTYSVLVDSSGAYAKEGAKVHVVRSGAFKGTGTEGTVVTDEQLAETQRRVDALNEQFLADVSAGRRMPMEKVRALADGRVHMAAAAKQFGLIDSIASLEQATQEIGRALMDEDNAVAMAAENEQLKQRLAEVEADAMQAQTALAEIAHAQKIAGVKAQLAKLDRLPVQEGFAEALISIEESVPEAYAALQTHLVAWNAQSATGELFREIGTSEGGKAPVDLRDPKAFRAAADAVVAEGKAKDRAEAMQLILRKQKAQGGN